MKILAAGLFLLAQGTAWAGVSGRWIAAIRPALPHVSGAGRSSARALERMPWTLPDGRPSQYASQHFEGIVAILEGIAISEEAFEAMPKAERAETLGRAIAAHRDDVESRRIKLVAAYASEPDSPSKLAELAREALDLTFFEKPFMSVKAHRQVAAIHQGLQERSGLKTRTQEVLGKARLKARAFLAKHPAWDPKYETELALSEDEMRAAALKKRARLKSARERPGKEKETVQANLYDLRQELLSLQVHAKESLHASKGFYRDWSAGLRLLDKSIDKSSGRIARGEAEALRDHFLPLLYSYKRSLEAAELPEKETQAYFKEANALIDLLGRLCGA